MVLVLGVGAEAVNLFLVLYARSFPILFWTKLTGLCSFFATSGFSRGVCLTVFYLGQVYRRCRLLILGLGVLGGVNRERGLGGCNWRSPHCVIGVVWLWALVCYGFLC